MNPEIDNYSEHGMEKGATGREAVGSWPAETVPPPEGVDFTEESRSGLGASEKTILPAGEKAERNLPDSGIGGDGGDYNKEGYQSRKG